jgi:hypothetical protein
MNPSPVFHPRGQLFCRLSYPCWKYCHDLWVTIDGVWIGYSNYWSLIYSRPVTTLYRSLTHTDYCPQSITISTSRFLEADFNTWTLRVSLNYTLHISHIKSSLHSRTLATKFFFTASPPELNFQLTGSKVKVIVTLRLAVYRQLVRIGVKPLETHDQNFFFQLNSCGNSPYVASSLTRRWVCLSWILVCLAFRQVYISHI